MKMGPKPKNRFKITCLECGVLVNNIIERNAIFYFTQKCWNSTNSSGGKHSMLQKIPLKLVQQKFSERKKHLVHLPIQIRFPIPSQQLMIVCHVILLIWNNPLRQLLKHVESRVQPPKNQQLFVRSHVNLQTQNVSWTVEKTQDRSDHPGLITMNGNLAVLRSREGFCALFHMHQSYRAKFNLKQECRESIYFCWLWKLKQCCNKWKRFRQA